MNGVTEGPACLKFKKPKNARKRSSYKVTQKSMRPVCRHRTFALPYGTGPVERLGTVIGKKTTRSQIRFEAH